MTTNRWFAGLCFGIALFVVVAQAMLSQDSSARDLLVRFCQLDAQGEQLSPEGWEKVAALFTMPGAPRRGRITVVRDFVVSNPAVDHGKAQFYVEYIELGRVDVSSARFSSLPAVKVRSGFEATTALGAKTDGRGEWRIAGPVPRPRVTVDTAIRYVTQLRENSKDQVFIKNADRTLAALKTFQ